jgi:hypothetical protein
VIVILSERAAWIEVFGGGFEVKASELVVIYGQGVKKHNLLEDAARVDILFPSR